MKGITSRLQVFLAKIAGKDVDVSTLTPPVAINEEEKLMLDIADRIDAIEEGGGLPAVTSEDNGDVLTVVNGAWAKALPVGAVYIFHTEEDSGTGKLVTAEKSGEIVAAYNAGKKLEAVGFPEIFWTVAGDSDHGYSLAGQSMYPVVYTGDNLMEMETLDSSVVATADLETDPFVLDIQITGYTLTPAEE